MVLEPMACVHDDHVAETATTPGLVGNCLACNLKAFPPSGILRLPAPASHHSCGRSGTTPAPAALGVAEELQRAAA